MQLAHAAIYVQFLAAAAIASQLGSDRITPIDKGFHAKWSGPTGRQLALEARRMLVDS
jgi:hypothetical protein